MSQAPAALIFAALAVGPTIANAKSLYVSHVFGSDNNLGTDAAPLQTFEHAVSLLAPGDTLVVMSELTNERLVINKSGTSTQPIKVTGRSHSIIETDGDAISIEGSFIQISGLEAHALGQGSAISVNRGSHHVVITGNVARDSGCGGIALIQTDYITIDHNRVYGNSRRSPWQCSGISMYQAINIDHDPGVHNLIARNTIYDNMDALVDNRVSASDGQTTDGNGIIVDDGRHTQNGSKDPSYDGLTIIENNIVFDNGGRGIAVFKSDHVIVRNNTTYHNLKDQNLRYRSAQGELTATFSDDVKYYNNIIVARPGMRFAASFGQTNNDVVWDYNLIDRNSGIDAEVPTGWGSHNIFAPALLRKPSTHPEEADFRPFQDSPAIATGDVAEAPPHDYEGKVRSRTGRIDLGAFQISDDNK